MAVDATLVLEVRNPAETAVWITTETLDLAQGRAAHIDRAIDPALPSGKYHLNWALESPGVFFVQGKAKFATSPEAGFPSFSWTYVSYGTGGLLMAAAAVVVQRSRRPDREQRAAQRVAQQLPSPPASSPAPAWVVTRVESPAAREWSEVVHADPEVTREREGPDWASRFDWLDAAGTDPEKRRPA